MASPITAIRGTLAHSLGVSKAEAKLIEANAYGVPGRWYRARMRTPVFANFEALAQRDASGAPIPGTLEWPLSDLAIRDQPVVDPGAYLVPVKMGFVNSDTSLADHQLRRMGFIAVAAIDSDGDYAIGWINPVTLLTSPPPPYVDAYLSGRAAAAPAPTPGGFALTTGAFSPRLPSSGIPGLPRIPIQQPQPVPYAPPIQVEFPTPPLIPPGVIEPEPTGFHLSKGMKIALVAGGVAAALLAFGPSPKPPKANRSRRKNRRKARRSR